MKKEFSILFCALLMGQTALMQSALAQTEAAKPPTSEATTPEAPAATENNKDAILPPAKSQPELKERRVVAFVATGVSLLAIAGGATMGVLANQQFACVEDVIACNADLDDPIVGAELLDAVAEVEHKSLIADMLYLAGTAAANVAITGFVRGYVLTGEPTEESDGAQAHTPTPNHPIVQLQLAEVSE